MVEASMVSQAPASLSHPRAVLFMCLVHSVETPFVIILPHFAQWWLISTRRVRMGRRVDVRTGITPLWRRRRQQLHPLRIRRDISAQGASRRKGGVSKRPWRTGTQADRNTTTVGIYDLSSRSIPELRGSRVKRVVGILLGSQVAISQEMALIPWIHRIGRKLRRSHKSVGDDDVGVVERVLCL
jgi:hypothetical protein